MKPATEVKVGRVIAILPKRARIGLRARNQCGDCRVKGTILGRSDPATGRTNQGTHSSIP